MKILITDFITGPVDREQSILGDVATVETLNAACEDDLVGRIEDAAAVVLYHVISMTRRTLERLECCKLIVRGGVGVDNVDLAAARRLGIPVANVPDYGTEDVANSAIAMMLALTRGIALANSHLRALATPWSYEIAAPLQRLNDRVYAVVGLGRIGMAAALRARALGMRVRFHDPYKEDGYDKAVGIQRAESLEDLLASAYALSIHCPLTDETRHLIDSGALGRMPAGSFLINTARGDIVDTTAVCRSVESGHLAGAGLDVLPTEPPPPDDPLIAAWRDPSHPAHHRVLITPHSAFYSEQGLVDLRIKTAEACRRALLGEPLRNVVN